MASPDIHPIENIWALIKRRLSDYHGRIDNIDDLKIEVDIKWHKLQPEFIKRFTDSIKRKLQAIIRGKGYQTNY